MVEEVKKFGGSSPHMKLGSLFDGIGGFPLAASMFGIEPVWASEIEKFPIEVTKVRFPNMKHLGDITEINGAEIEPVDIISAGSPCQDLSVAGKRAGLDGARSGLFMDFVRIVREMREATNGRYPSYVIWENVPGAFSSNGGQDFRAVLEEVAETEIPMPESGKWAAAGMVRGNGRSLAWRVLDAQYFGVPQRRKRIFLVADLTGERAGQILFERESLSGNFEESGEQGETVAGDTGEGVEGTGDKCECLTSWDCQSKRIFNPDGVYPALQAMNGGGANNTSVLAVAPFNTGQVTSPQNGNRVEYGLPCHTLSHNEHPPSVVIEEPNAVAFQPGNIGRQAGADPSEKVFPTLGATTLGDQFPHIAIENHPSDSRMKLVKDNIMPTLTGKMGMGGNNGPMVMDPTYGIQGSMVGRQDKNGPQGSGICEDVSFTLNTIDRHAVAFNITQCDANGTRKDRPNGGLYVNETEKANTVTAKSSGIETAVAQYWNGDQVTGTLSCRNAGGQQRMPDKDHFHGVIETPSYAVRRLTPLECERLQGFYDGWTDIEGASDTARYKALGNSVAVPCVAWIMSQIVGGQH